MTLYEYIMSNHETINMFGKYWGIQGTLALFWAIKGSQKGSKC